MVGGGDFAFRGRIRSRMSALTADDIAAVEAAADAYLTAMRAGDWALVAQSFTEDAVRIPQHEEPHQGRDAIEAWLGGIEELSSYELTRDQVDGADGLAYVRGRYAITLRPEALPGRSPTRAISSRSGAGAGPGVACRGGDLEHPPATRGLIFGPEV